MSTEQIHCIDCDTDKGVLEFNVRRLYKDGTTGVCKSCIDRNMPVERTCSKCKEVKPIEEFGKLLRNKFDKHTVCKVCSKSKMRKHYEENYDELHMKKKIYRDEHKEEKAKQDKWYREANREQIAEVRKQYRENNKEVIAHKKKMYYASDAGREVKTRSALKRQIQIRETEDGSITKSSLDELYTAQDARCYICDLDLTQLKRKNVHLDHIKPLSKGGKHILENVAWSCAQCNMSKGARE